MDVNGLIYEIIQLFSEKKYAEAIEILHQAWDEITDKSTRISEQCLIQTWLGCCYFEQAKRTKDEDKAEELFGQAIKHFQERFELHKQLTDGNEQDLIPDQIGDRFWLGSCYLEQAKKTEDTDKAGELFGLAVKHYQKRLQLAKQLTNEQNGILQQISAQSDLGRCYLEQIKRSKSISEAEKFVKQAGEKFSAAYEQLSQLSDEKEKKVWEKIIRPGLRDSYYLGEDWNSYFEKKKQEIQESLFKGETSQPQDAVATVLAVLHIPPIELSSIPLAHYTSPHVCHILFGIGGNDTASPMRIGSSTYMNDPSEGRGLLDLLNQQDLELENKADGASHNAFFTCFSSRVNDLNQFRLYGKEDGVEASGCCLVFNKNGDWLKEVDVSVPFRSLSQKSGQDSDGLPEAGFSDNKYEKLPLYQVAYIAYKDEYIADKKCRIWFPSQKEPKFGIRLKPVGNEDWHQIRLGKLKEALEELIRFFEDKSAVSDDDKEALEYIRYLFKDFAFRDEEEFRLLVIKPINSEEIEYCEKTQSVYIPYADIRNRADEVILGTNYEKTGNQRKAEVFRYQMKQKCPDVKVSRSTLPINPPNK